MSFHYYYYHHHGSGDAFLKKLKVQDLDSDMCLTGKVIQKLQEFLKKGVGHVTGLVSSLPSARLTTPRTRGLRFLGGKAEASMKILNQHAYFIGYPVFRISHTISLSFSIFTVSSSYNACGIQLALFCPRACYERMRLSEAYAL